jgi:hydroxymethylglutaryl-CoA reductase (NADPH)
MHCETPDPDLTPDADSTDELRPPRVPGGAGVTPHDLERRWRLLAGRDVDRAALVDAQTVAQLAAYQGNIENLIGTVKVPVGLAGPLRINGSRAQGYYYLPLATTEAALVASYSRGAQLISDAGGCTARLLDEHVGRAPGFAFRTLDEAMRFADWAVEQFETFKRLAAETTRYGRLVAIRPTIVGNFAYLHFDFTTGDAAGQNMVTIATNAICGHIGAHTPIQPQQMVLEANLSGDKKACAHSFVHGRGKRVSADVVVPAPLVRARLHTSPQRMIACGRMSGVGAVLSGTFGMQGHYANALAALFIACGQDAACVAECAVGISRFDLTAEGDLYASVTLPNLTVGTVGGGTGLPCQRACLAILGLVGAGNAQGFAEVCAGLCLAGELSLTGALAADQFARAHQRLARGRRDVPVRQGGGAPLAVDRARLAQANPAHGGTAEDGAGPSDSPLGDLSPRRAVGPR